MTYIKIPKIDWSELKWSRVRASEAKIEPSKDRGSNNPPDPKNSFGSNNPPDPKKSSGSNNPPIQRGCVNHIDTDSIIALLSSSANGPHSLAATTHIEKIRKNVGAHRSVCGVYQHLRSILIYVQFHRSGPEPFQAGRAIDQGWHSLEEEEVYQGCWKVVMRYVDSRLV